MVDPKYDYFPQTGGYMCIVTLGTGARFQGALTRTQEESAESAACLALLNVVSIYKNMSQR